MAVNSSSLYLCHSCPPSSRIPKMPTETTATQLRPSMPNLALPTTDRLRLLRHRHRLLRPVDDRHNPRTSLSKPKSMIELKIMLSNRINWMIDALLLVSFSIVFIEFELFNILLVRLPKFSFFFYYMYWELANNWLAMFKWRLRFFFNWHHLISLEQKTLIYKCSTICCLAVLTNNQN